VFIRVHLWLKISPKMLPTRLHSLQAILRHRAFVALVDQAAVSIASFGTGMLLSRAFVATREQLGLYYLSVTIGILIIEIQNALVSTPLTVTLPTLTPEKLRRFIGSSLIHQGALSAAITLVLAVLAFCAPMLHIPGHRPMLIACSITAGAVALRNFARFLNFALHRPHIAAITDWLVTLFQLSGIILLQMSHHLTAWSAVAVIGLASLIGGALALMLSRQFIQTQLAKAWPDFRSNWRLSRWVFASGVVGNAGVSLYPWVIDRLASTIAVGPWGNANTVSSAANPVMMGLQNWMAPAIAHAYTDRTREQYRLYVTRLASVFLIMLPFMLLALYLISKPLLLHGYHDFTPQAVWLVLLLAAGSLFQAIGFCFTRGLFSLGRGAIDTWTNVLPLIELLVVGIPLVIHYGALGGAVSLLLAQMIAAAVRAVAFWNVCRTPTASIADNTDLLPAASMEAV
jgi:O-antigen/teichoic acid export membrane protein